MILNSNYLVKGTCLQSRLFSYFMYFNMSFIESRNFRAGRNLGKHLAQPPCINEGLQFANNRNHFCLNFAIKIFYIRVAYRIICRTGLRKCLGITEAGKIRRVKTVLQLPAQNHPSKSSHWPWDATACASSSAISRFRTSPWAVLPVFLPLPCCSASSLHSVSTGPASLHHRLPSEAPDDGLNSGHMLMHSLQGWESKFLTSLRSGDFFKRRRGAQKLKKEKERKVKKNVSYHPQR